MSTAWAAMNRAVQINDEGDEGQQDENAGQERRPDGGAALRRTTPEELAEADAAAAQLLHRGVGDGCGSCQAEESFDQLQ